MSPEVEGGAGTAESRTSGLASQATMGESRTSGLASPGHRPAPAGSWAEVWGLVEEPSDVPSYRGGPYTTFDDFREYYQCTGPRHDTQWYNGDLETERLSGGPFFGPAHVRRSATHNNWRG